MLAELKNIVKGSEGVGDKLKGRIWVPKLCRIVCPKCYTVTSLEQDMEFVMKCVVKSWMLKNCRIVVAWEWGGG